MGVKKYSVYILIKDKKAVYVGCSCNVPNRVSKHKATKNFDKHVVLKCYESKQLALNAENAIIRFLTMFGDGDWYNSEDILLSYYTDTVIRS